MDLLKRLFTELMVKKARFCFQFLILLYGTNFNFHICPIFPRMKFLTKFSLVFVKNPVFILIIVYISIFMNINDYFL